MHACIAAFSTGVPVVPLAYSRKFNGLFTSLGYHWLADGKVLTTTQAVQAILDGFKRRRTLDIDIARAMGIVEQRLNHYESFLARELARLVNENGGEKLCEC